MIVVIHLDAINERQIVDAAPICGNSVEM